MVELDLKHIKVSCLISKDIPKGRYICIVYDNLIYLYSFRNLNTWIIQLAKLCGNWILCIARQICTTNKRNPQYQTFSKYYTLILTIKSKYPEFQHIFGFRQLVLFFSMKITTQGYRRFENKKFTRIFSENICFFQ